MLKKMPYEYLGFAKLDHQRTLRSGFGEVVYCEGKSIDHLKEIFKKFYERDTNVLGTRASKEQYEAVKMILPMVQYDVFFKDSVVLDNCCTSNYDLYIIMEDY